MHVRDGEAEMVVLNVGGDVAVQFEFGREQLLPGVAVLAVEGDVRNLRLLGRHSAIAGREVDVAGGAFGVRNGSLYKSI